MPCWIGPHPKNRTIIGKFPYAEWLIFHQPMHRHMVKPFLPIIAVVPNPSRKREKKRHSPCGHRGKQQCCTVKFKYFHSFSIDLRNHAAVCGHNLHLQLWAGYCNSMDTVALPSSFLIKQYDAVFHQPVLKFLYIQITRFNLFLRTHCPCDACSLTQGHANAHNPIRGMSPVSA